VSQKRANFSEL